MGAPKGNQFWKARSSHGANPKFTKETLWPACEEYFQWVEDNPLKEEKIFHSQGEITTGTLHKMRAMTIGGLCLFLDITPITWGTYREDKDLSYITTQVDQIIYDQKFSGASADLLNANIIARDLGLKDNKDVTTGGKEIKATSINLANVDSETLEKLMNADN